MCGVMLKSLEKHGGTCRYPLWVFRPVAGVEISESAHPVPDENGLKAPERI